MNGSGTQPGSMGSGPIGRATSPQPPNSGIAGLPNKPSNATTRYSLGSGVSSSGSATSPTAVGSGKDGSAGASKNMSVLRSPNLGSGSGNNNLASSPISSARGLRPSSEMLSGYPQSATGFRSPLASASFGATAAQFANAASVGGMMKGAPESDAIDKWFEDLQHYEATLEEMAAASLDLNFKEELSAIEQCESIPLLLSSRIRLTRRSAHRVPRPFRGREDRGTVQSAARVDAGANPLLHHGAPADDPQRPRQRPAQPRRRPQQ